MRYIIEYLAAAKIVQIKMNGRINFQTAEKYSKEAIRLARENNCSKFLINHKETSLVSSFTNLFTTGSDLQQFGFKNSDKIAIVIKRISNYKYSKEYQIGNISWSKFKYFNSNKVEDAVNWLSK